MDVTLTASGLIEELTTLTEAGDFEGAEELLLGSLARAPERLNPFLHYQLGRIYIRWNKLSSAINHLNLAAEAAHQRGDELFVLQVVEELKFAKSMQLKQKP